MKKESLPPTGAFEAHSSPVPALRVLRTFGFILACTVLGVANVRGGVMVLGSNDSGQKNVPPGATNVVALSFGAFHVVSLNRSGAVLAWGYNLYGQTSTPTDLTNVVRVGAGERHSLAVRTDGTVAAWGQNSCGQTNIPADLTNVIAVAGGRCHSLALKSDGTVTAWGDSAYGQLNVPADLINAAAISAGAEFSLAARRDGTVTAWGRNEYGQCNVPLGLSGVVAVAGGGTHALALKQDGTVVAWGDNADGRATVPANATNVVAIAAGNASSIALRRDGTLVGWGLNSYGEITVPSSATNLVGATAGFRNTALLVGAGPPFISTEPVSANAYSGTPVGFRVAASGQWPLTYQWRSNGTNIPGATNAILSINNPHPTDAGSYAVIVSNALGSATSAKAELTVVNAAPIFLAQPTNQIAYVGKTVIFAASAAGSGPHFYQWQHDGADVAGATSPTLTLNAATAADAGNYSLIASNAFGTTSSSSARLTVPPLIEWPGEYYPSGVLTNIVSVAASDAGRLALRRDGLVLGWDGVPVSGLTNVMALEAGYSHFLALRSDGTVTAWGGNNFGQVNTPPGLSNVVAIGAGDYTSFAIREDGTLAAWGKNSTVPNSWTNIVAASGGSAFNVALRADGKVLTWGGAGSFNQTNVPPGLTPAVAVAASVNFTLALKSDGTVTGWGDISAYGPIIIPAGLTNAAAVSAGNLHLLILRGDGTVTGLGYYSTFVPVGLTNVTALVAERSIYDRSAVLAGNIAPFVATRPGQRIAGGGQDVGFGVKATGSLPLRYQWQFNGTNLAGMTTPLLFLSNVQASQAGNYSIVVTNAFGATTNAVASLTVTSTPPQILSQPTNQSAFRGATVSFNALANGSQPFNYQWQFNGTDLPGATVVPLVLTNVQSAQNGDYRVVVSNAYGFAFSSNAALAVLTPLGEALNATGLVWTTSGSGNWFGEPTVKHDGGEAAQSGVITHNQQSTLQTTVAGPGNLTFWWKVSSELYWDTLKFYVGGAETGSISGEAGWQPQNFSVPAGSQTLQWIYAKDGSQSSGQDAGWVDEVSFTGTSVPFLVAPFFATNTFAVSVQTVNGKTYMLEFKNTLTDSNWTALPGVLGDGTVKVLMDTNANSPQRFFRVRQQD